MAYGKINTDTLSEIADAIRSWNGEDTAYKPGEMADAILNLEGIPAKKQVVIYLNYDGTYLYAYLAEYGDAAIDPEEEGLIDAPTRESDDEGNTYYYSGWDNLPTEITEEITVITATYKSYGEITVTTYKGIANAYVLSIAESLGYTEVKPTQGYFYYYYDADELIYSAKTSSTTNVLFYVDSNVSTNIMIIGASVSNVTVSVSGNVIKLTRNTSTSTNRLLIISAEAYEEYYDELFSSYTLTEVATY